MKIIILALLLIRICSGEEKQDSLWVDQKALVFELENLISLSSFEGGTLTYRKIYSPGAERRYTFLINARYRMPTHVDETELYFPTNDSTSTVRSTSGTFSHSTQFAVSSIKIRHSMGGNSIDFYRGWGPMLGLGISGSLYKSSTNVNSNINPLASVHAGIIWAMGAEWKINDKFSLCAEYNLTGLLDLSFRRDRSEYENSAGTKIKQLDAYYNPSLSTLSNTLFSLSIWL